MPITFSGLVCTRTSYSLRSGWSKSYAPPTSHILNSRTWRWVSALSWRKCDRISRTRWKRYARSAMAQGSMY